ncbi:unnamed protein product [Closterium sp. NIES-53]
MIVFATFLRDDQIVTEFLALLTVEKAYAASLCSLLLSHLRAVGVDLRRISCVSTDGAMVMVGPQSGVVARLQMLIPNLVSFHCIAHRRGIGCQSCSRGYPNIRHAAGDLHVREPRGAAVAPFIGVLPAIVVMLAEWKDQTMYELITSYRFQFLLRFLADVLELLNVLSKVFQHREVSDVSVYDTFT